MPHCPEAADRGSSVEATLWASGVPSLQPCRDLLIERPLSGIVSPVGKIHGIQYQGVVARVTLLAVLPNDPVGYFAFLTPEPLRVRFLARGHNNVLIELQAMVSAWAGKGVPILAGIIEPDQRKEWGC